MTALWVFVATALTVVALVALARATRRARPVQLTPQELRSAFAALRPGEHVSVSGVIARRLNRRLWELQLPGGPRWASTPDQAADLLRQYGGRR